MNFRLIGVNHNSAPVEVRERLAIPESRLAEALQRLVRHPGVDEGLGRPERPVGKGDPQRVDRRHDPPSEGGGRHGIADPEIKREIRSAAEAEEYEGYVGGRMPAEWLEALAPSCG